MPAKSAKQYRFMQMMAHKKGDHPIGPSKEVAEEFVKKTPANKRKEFSKHGK